MILKVYSVYDKAVEQYRPPQFAVTRGEMVRHWSKLVNDKDWPFHEAPGDYTLFEIGEYDTNSGVMTSMGTHDRIGSALEFTSKEQ